MDDLHKFRKQWLAELHDGKEKSKQKDSLRNAKKRKLSDTIVKTSVDDEKRACRLKKPKSQSLPSAFDIANRYLSTDTYCRFCERERKNYTKSLCNICKEETSDKVFSADEISKNDSKLYEVLIADFDEINSIPFFDLELPKEIAVNIFQYLSLNDLMHCSLVNSKWKALASDDLIWFNLCSKLDIDVKGTCVNERSDWKDFVKDCMIERHEKRRKWKERLCEIRELENEKGGIICAADVYDKYAAVSYIDGTIRLWNMEDASYQHDIKERYTNDEDIILAMCTSIKISQNVCVAGFKNGDVMIWQLGGGLYNSIDFMNNYDGREIVSLNIDSSSCYISIQLISKQVILRHSQNNGENWNWEQVHESYHEKVSQLILINSMTSSNLKLLTCLPKQLNMCLVCAEESNIVLGEIVDACFSCVDSKGGYVVAAVSGVGYSVLDGYRIRRYDIETARQVSNLIGSQTRVLCMSYKTNHDEDVIAVGCSDATIKIHSFKSENTLLTIYGIPSVIRTLQLDKWKVVSGHEDGSVCLYDSMNGFKYWQTNVRHPVHLCSFDETLLACVAIPNDKSPQNSYWNANDLVQRKKFRGSLCVMDFSKDLLENIPSELRADYDNITGYDYNIDLIAPYDDVTAYNLPQI